MTFVRKTLVAAALTGAVFAAPAQAAHLELVADTGSASFDYSYDLLLDDVAASDAVGAVGGFDATGVSVFGGVDSLVTGSANGSVEQGFFGFGAVSADASLVSLSFSQFALLSAGNDGVVSGSAASAVTLSGLQLRVVADEGDVAGNSVRLSFAGLADAYAVAGEGSSSGMSYSLNLSRGGSSLASLSDVYGTIGFDTVVRVGDVLDLSFVLSGYASQEGFAYTAGDFRELSVSGLVDGGFALAPVPEPKDYLMLLSGLVVIGLMARRRT